MTSILMFIVQIATALLFAATAWVIIRLVLWVWVGWEIPGGSNE